MRILTIATLAAFCAGGVAFAQQPAQRAPAPLPTPAQTQPAAPAQGAPAAQPAPAPVAAPSAAVTKADVGKIHACIDKKAPEGELPPEGPKRDKVLEDAEGGPQACIGLINEECQKANGSEEACILREATAWLAALRLEGDKFKAIDAGNRRLYDGVASKIADSAANLCRAAAAVSAWGAEAVKNNDKDLVFDATNACVADAIAQQSLILLVNRRGS